jgi:hypothetical protein
MTTLKSEGFGTKPRIILADDYRPALEAISKQLQA